MAGGILQNTVLTNFKTTGHQQTVGAANAVSESIRPLGDNAINAARGFSSMQKGLGGFVGAYAGAAATFFALQQAFSALKEAAKLEQSLAGTATLAAAIGQNGDALLVSIQKITRGQLTLRDAAESANLALSSGFDSSQIEKLSTIATKASKALGRDLGDSFIRLVRGAAKLEPELLDELGIFTRIDPAVQAYAEQMGKSEKFLTNFERRQAFVNAVTEEGQRKFETISTAANTSISALERLTASLTNLGHILTNVIATSFAPFADFLSGSLANSFSAIGLIGGLAFAKLFQLITSGLKSTSTKLDAFADRITDKIKAKTKLDPSIAGNLSIAASNFNPVTAKSDPNTVALVSALRKPTFTTSEVKSLQSDLERSRTAAITAIRTEFARSGFSPDPIINNLRQFNNLSPKDVKNSLAVDYGVTTSNRGRSPGSLKGTEFDETAKLVRAAAGTDALLASIEKYNQAQSTATKGFALFAEKAKNFGTGLISMFDRITMAFSRILFWFSALELAFSFLLKITDNEGLFDSWFKGATEFGAALFGLDKNAKEFKKTISDIAEVNLAQNFKKANIKETTKLDFGKSLFGIEYDAPQEQSDFQKRIASALKNATNDMRKAAAVTNNKGVVKTGFVLDSEGFSKSLDATAESIRSNLVPQSYEAAVALRAVFKTIEDLKEAGPGYINVLQKLSSEFGVSAQQFGKSFVAKDFIQKDLNVVSLAFTDLQGQAQNLEFLTLEGIQKAREKLREESVAPVIVEERMMSPIFGESSKYRRTEDKFDQKIFNQKVQELDNEQKARAATLSTKAFGDQLNDYLKSTNINADGLSQLEAGYKNVLAEAESLYYTQVNMNLLMGDQDSDQLKVLGKHLELQKRISEETLKRTQTVQNQLSLGTQLVKTFQAEINLAQEFSGAIGPNGSLSFDAKDMRANMLQNLSRVIDTGDKQINPTANSAEVQNARTAQNILKGLYIKTSQDIKVLNQSLEKEMTQSLEAVFHAENVLIKTRIQGAIQASQITITALKSEFDYKVQLKDLEVQIADIQSKAAIQESQSQINRLNAAKSILDEEQNALEIAYRRKDSEAELASLIKTRSLKQQSELLDYFANFSADNPKFNLDFQVEIANIDKLTSALDRQVEKDTANIAIKQKQLDVESQIAKQNYQMGVDQAAAEKTKIQAEIDKLNLQKELADKSSNSQLAIFAAQQSLAQKDYELQTSKIDSDRKLREQELQLQRERILLLQDEAQILNNHVQALAKIFASSAATQDLMSSSPSARAVAAKRTANPIKTLTDDYVPIILSGISAIKTNADAARDSVDELSRLNNLSSAAAKDNAAEELANKQRVIAGEESEFKLKLDRDTQLRASQLSVFTKQLALADAGLADIEKTYQEQQKLIDLKGKNFEDEISAINEKAAAERRALEQQKDAARVGLFSNIAQAVRGVTESLFKETTTATEGLQAAQGSLFKARESQIISENQIALTALQSELTYTLQIKDVRIQIEEANSRAATAALQAQINRLNATKAILDEENRALDIAARRKDAEVEIAYLRKTQNLQLLTEVSDAFSNFFSDTTKREMKFTLDEANIDKLIKALDRQVEKEIKSTEIREKQLDIEAKIAEKTYQMALVQSGMEQKRIDSEIEKVTLQRGALEEERRLRLEMLARQENIAKKDFELQTAKIQSDKALRDHELNLQKERINLLNREAAMLTQHVEGLGLIYANSLAQNEFMLAKGGLGTTSPEAAKIINDNPDNPMPALVAMFTRGIKKVVIDSEAAVKAVEKLGQISNETFTAIQQQAKTERDTKLNEIEGMRTELKKELDTKKEVYSSTITMLEAQKAAAGVAAADALKTYQETLKNIDLKKVNNAEELKAIKDKAAGEKEAYLAQLARLKKIKELEDSQSFKFLNDLQGILKNNFTKGIEDLTTALFEGTLTWENFMQGFKDWAGTLARDIGKAAVNRFIFEPLMNYVQDQLSGVFSEWFGLDLNKDKIGTYSSDGKNLNVTVSNMPTGTVADKSKGPTGPYISDAASVTATGYDRAGNYVPPVASDYADPKAAEANGAAVTAAASAAKESSSVWGGFAKSFGDNMIAIVGSMGSVLAAGGDFKKALPGIFISVMGQIINDLAKSGGGGLGGLGKAAGGIFDGIGGWLGKAFGGSSAAAGLGGIDAEIAAWSAMASGGSVSRFAAGGKVNNYAGGGNVGSSTDHRNTGRDTVSAKLEPGEFVLRKHAVDRLGLTMLNQLNSHGFTRDSIENDNSSTNNYVHKSVRHTENPIVNNYIRKKTSILNPINSSDAGVRRFSSGGYVGGSGTSAPTNPLTMYKPPMSTMRTSPGSGGSNQPPNVNVNVTNNGTPQKVEGQPKIKFDPEKMIIDVVLKDFGNNGPIRQTLRGNAF